MGLRPLVDELARLRPVAVVHLCGDLGGHRRVVRRPVVVRTRVRPPVVADVAQRDGHVRGEVPPPARHPRCGDEEHRCHHHRDRRDEPADATPPSLRRRAECGRHAPIVASPTFRPCGGLGLLFPRREKARLPDVRPESRGESVSKRWPLMRCDGGECGQNVGTLLLEHGGENRRRVVLPAS